VLTVQGVQVVRDRKRIGNPDPNFSQKKVINICKAFVGY